MVVAHGIGPRNFRFALIAAAILYFTMLVHTPNDPGALRPVIFFMQATALFPRADSYALEFRVQAWSCNALAWRSLDPSPYFPIQADDKESRLQRVAYFYGVLGGSGTNNKTKKLVMHALDDYIYASHGESPGEDGVDGPIGGIRLVQLDTELPPVGSEVVRYVWNPLAPIPEPIPDCGDLKPHEHVPACNLFYASQTQRKKRCETPIR
jgi:hypothetical protein